MRTFAGAAIVATSLLCCGATGAANPANDYERLIVGGRWLGAHDLKYRIFYANGRWAVQRNDFEAPDSSGNRRWWIKGDTLIYTYRHWRYTERIISISRTRLVTGDPPGYVRVRSPIPKRRDTSNGSPSRIWVEVIGRIFMRPGAVPGRVCGRDVSFCV